MPAVLVLGGNGFVGTFLTEFLLETDSRLTTVSRTLGNSRSSRHHHVVLDVRTQSQGLRSLVEQREPECIINLVGGRDDGVWEYAQYVYRLCWMLADLRTSTRLLLIGSAAEYGVPSALPVDETHPLNPTSGYGLSRAIQSWIARTMWEEHGVPVTVARLFNVIGPGQSDAFAAGSMVRQAADVLSGRLASIAVGNVHAVRDFIDIRDAVRALAWTAWHGSPGEAYNVCSGRPTSIEELLHLLAALTGLKGAFYRSVEERLRNDVPAVYGSRKKLTAESGWLPALDLRQSLSDMVAFELRGRTIR